MNSLAIVFGLSLAPVYAPFDDVFGKGYVRPLAVTPLSMKTTHISLLRMRDS